MSMCKIMHASGSTPAIRQQLLQWVARAKNSPSRMVCWRDCALRKNESSPSPNYSQKPTLT